MRRGAFAGLAAVALVAALIVLSTRHPVRVRTMNGVPRAPSANPQPVLVSRAAAPRLANPAPNAMVGGVLVSGRVLDAGGGPVPSAVVTSGTGASASSATSAPDGRFELRTPEGPGVIRAAAEGYRTGHRLVVAPQADVDIVLLPASSIVGRVVESDDGRPVAGVTVRAVANGALYQEGTAVSGAGGDFRIRNLGSGVYAVSAHSGSWSSREPSTVELGVAEESSPLTIAVSPATTVTGFVYVGDRPCEPGEGSVRLEGGGDLRMAPTGEDGAVRLDGVLPGTYAVNASCDGSPRLDARLTVGPDGVTGRRWVLDEGLVVRGIVRYAGGGSAGGFRVDVSPATADLHNPGSTCTTDADGRFSCGGLTAGWYDCVVAGQRGPLSAKLALDVTSRLPPVELTIAGVGSVEVAVTDSRGAPLDAVPVRVEDSTGRAYAGERRGAGKFVVRELAPGAYRVSAGLPGAPSSDVTSVKVADGIVSLVALRSAAPRARIEGHVVDEQRAPVPDVLITLEAEGPIASNGGAFVPPVLSGADGAFLIERVNPGTYRLEAEHARLGTTLMSGVTTDAPVTVVLATPASVSGKVTTTDGRPVPRFRLLYSGPGPGAGRVVDAPDGAFSIRSLTPGSWSIVASAVEGVAETSVTLAPGEHAEGVELRVQAQAATAVIPATGGAR